MTVKDRVMQLLIENSGEYISGEDMAEKLGVTRASVWKAVRNLEKEGLSIDSRKGAGYRLAPGSDEITGVFAKGFDIEILPEAQSTNNTLKAMAASGAPEGKVVIAKRQLGGKGRLGRSFFSPSGGIYMSLLLRPDIRADEAWRITTAAAVAVCSGIEAVCGVDAAIKWVNDVYVGQRKVCGILTEASLDIETGGLDYAVLGIGINVYPPEGGYPADIADRAGYLLCERRRGVMDALASAVLEKFKDFYEGCREYMEEYCARQMLMGRRVMVTPGDYEAEVLYADTEGGLVVRPMDGGGEVVRLMAGEVSLKI